ncbi:MAG: endolytic transglycosylase MltG, partial [Candidatus Paceibacterota bacterium]
WNRLFINMNLQIDATLQYVKADASAAQGWWPKVVPADRFRKSAYNTYLHPGLPPTPIASPSVAAILAALNPRETSCLFYFHDANRQFHCTDTYAEHVALLKKYYGRGK